MSSPLLTSVYSGYNGSSFTLEQYLALKRDVNRCLSYIDNIQGTESDLSNIGTRMTAAETAIGNISNLSVGADLVISVEALDASLTITNGNVANTDANVAAVILDLSNTDSNLGNTDSNVATVISDLDNLEAFVGTGSFTTSNLSSEAAAGYNLATYAYGLIGDESTFPNVGATIAWHLIDFNSDIATNASDISNTDSNVANVISDLSNTDSIVSGHTTSISTLTSDLDAAELAIGNISNLDVAATTDLVAAVNSASDTADFAVSTLGNIAAYPISGNVSVNLTTLADYIGDEPNLTVGANLADGINTLHTEIGNIANLTVDSDLVSGIETLHSEIGNISNLVVDSDLVSGIETLHSEIGNISNLTVAADLVASTELLGTKFDDVSDYTATYYLNSTTISGVSIISGWTEETSSSHTMNANGYLDIGKSGTYLFTFNCYFSSDTSDSPTDKQSLYIRNRTTSKVIGFMTDHRSVDSDAGMICHAVAAVSASDQMTFEAYTQDAGTNTVGSATYPLRIAIVYICP